MQFGAILPNPVAEVVTASGMAVAELHEDYFSPEVTEAFLDLQRKWKEFSEPELMFSLKKPPTKKTPNISECCNHSRKAGILEAGTLAVLRCIPHWPLFSNES